MRKFLIKYFIFLLISSHFFSQNVGNESNNAEDYIPKILPSSPESFKFGSYGNIPIGLFTGEPNINIPLANFSKGDISIPISLNYSSNGIKVDEMNGSVGLGWKLIGAGVITRTVRDLPDETVNDSKPVPNIDVLGLWSPDVVNYINYATNEGADSESDIYMANFSGHSLKFVFDKLGRPYLISQNNYKIFGINGGNEFKIITPDGITYIFNSIETSLFRNVGGVHTPPESYNSSWYLSKIIDKKGNEVNIEYYNISYTTILSQSQTMTYTPPGAIQYKLEKIQDNFTAAGYHCEETLYYIAANPNTTVISSRQTLSGKQIKRIYVQNDTEGIIQEMNFEYYPRNYEDYNSLKKITYKSLNQEQVSYSFNYETTANGRMFLKEIINNKDNSIHSFEYINKNALPERLSFSRDIWGLYNGKNNSTLIPQIFDQTDLSSVRYNGANQSFDEVKANSGLLNKITYPTKGSTEIIYEPHVRPKQIIIPGLKTSVNLRVRRGDDDLIAKDFISITPIKDEIVPIILSSNFSNQCDVQLNTGKSKSTVTIKNSNGEDIPLYTYSSSISSLLVAQGGNIINQGETKTLYLKLKKNETINITLEARFYCTEGSVSFSYTTEPDTIQEVNEPFGGFRVNKTIDNALDGKNITRKYTYSPVTVVREPYFLEEKRNRSYCGYLFSDLVYNSLTSSNIAQLNATSPNIFYSTVQEEIQGKGVIVHYFDTSMDYFGKTLIGKDISTSTWTNFGWKNGKELKTEYKDYTGKKIKEVNNNYVENTSKTIGLDAISLRKNFELDYYGYVTLKCTAENINSFQEFHVCNANHNHFWTPAYGTSWRCIASGHNNVVEKFYSYCYGHNIGETIVKPNIFENIDVVQYKNISRFDYLQSQSSTDFLNGKALVTTTEYFYNNPNHYQLTNQTTTFPDSSISKTTYQYAHEKGNQYLIDKNIVGIPLQTTVAKIANGSTKTLSDVETKYPISQTDANTKTNGLALPYEVISNDYQGNSNKEVSYKKYDNKGNLQEYVIKPDVNGNGIPVTIIWGYNQTQPIAKIEGAKYDDVKTLQVVLDAITSSNADALDPTKESGLIASLDKLRDESTLKNFQITTYTYDPLIGVTSITPTNGVREIYKYDTANRLEKVVDINGNILKEYKYHYKQ